MSVASPPRLVTAEEFAALPDDGVERWVAAGVLRESGSPMTKRDKNHAATEAAIAQILKNWLDGQPKPRGRVYSGGVGAKLAADPLTVVGIDVAYFSPEVVEASRDEAYLEGAPILAVEILSRYNTCEEINKKLGLYRAASTPLVWIVDPDERTVIVHRLGRKPKMFNDEESLDAADLLLGFRTEVGRIFGD